MTNSEKLEVTCVAVKRKYPMAFSATSIMGAKDERTYSGYMVNRPSSENAGCELICAVRLWNDGKFEVVELDTDCTDAFFKNQNQKICDTFREEFLKVDKAK